MITIPLKTIHEVWDRVDESSEQEADQLAHKAQKEQPYVLVYLLAMDENLTQDEEERGRLLHLGIIIWEVMSSAHPHLSLVMDKDLDAAEQANYQHLEALEEGSEIDYLQSVQKLVDSYNQMPLLATIMEALMEGYEAAPELAPESIGLALLCLKTVIDCLDQ